MAAPCASYLTKHILKVNRINCNRVDLEHHRLRFSTPTLHACRECGVFYESSHELQFHLGKMHGSEL
ncbi:unnamed protein product [Hymenolepis diminuta]|uniref:C2H2-type domain-containing protein n=1 Tax=Hymenolepis diminuta TaxID=6216 RepID=A0A564ZAY7_HYMDI|nr:unnamed protein product [Hymenolepis diminuta]